MPALARYWKAADDLGYARITCGDGLGDWTHDGWTMLGALAVLTRRARIGPAVTYAFDASSHHPSWLAKRAVTVAHLSGGRLDLRLAVGAEDAAAARGWAAHLAGAGAAIAERMAAYEAAGTTDLMLGFADFPFTGMLEAFAATVLHGRSPAS